MSGRLASTEEQVASLLHTVTSLQFDQKNQSAFLNNTSNFASATSLAALEAFVKQALFKVNEDGPKALMAVEAMKTALDEQVP